jgi:site-specific recombinase XerD
MLQLYRRHGTNCQYRSRTDRRCKCPLWVQGSVGGGYVRQALKLRNWEAAQTHVREWEAKGARLARLIPVQTAVKKYLEDAESRKLKASTLRLLRADFEKDMLSWCERKGIKAISLLTPENLTDWRNEWTEQPSTSMKKLERTRSFFKFCMRMEWLERNPASLLRPPKVPPSATLPFTADEVAQLVSATDLYRNEKGQLGTPHAKRLRALILLMRYTGLRISDAVGLPRSAVKDGKVFLQAQKKTGTPVWVPVPPIVIAALDQEPKSETHYFWTGEGQVDTCAKNWQRSFRKLAKISKVPNAHPHRLRDTFAVELLLRGVPIESVGILLGHNSVRVTEKHYSPWVRERQEKLEEMVRRAWVEIV